MVENGNPKTSPPRTKFIGWWVQSPRELFNAIELFLRNCGGPLGSPVDCRVIHDANKCARHLSLICPYLPEPPWPDPRESWKNGWAALTLVEQWCKKAHPVWESYFAEKEDVGNGAGQGPLGESPTAKQTGEQWSRPMPLTDIADRILKDSKKSRKVKSVYKDRLKKLGDKSWMIRLDGLPPNIVKELERV